MRLTDNCLLVDADKIRNMIKVVGDTEHISIYMSPTTKKLLGDAITTEHIMHSDAGYSEKVCTFEGARVYELLSLEVGAVEIWF